MLDHELKITGKPILAAVLIARRVGGGPLAIIFLLKAITGDHEVVAEGDEVVSVGSEGLLCALLLHLELMAALL